MNKIISIEHGNIFIDGEKIYFLSGEVHYFRIDPDNWEDRLDKLIEAGCNTVAFYVPWFVHEPEEGLFDFTGRLHERNNLVRWLDAIKRKNLLAFARPGPYVYAEMTNSGIPDWFLRNYPQAKAVKWTGKKFDYDFFQTTCSYLHPVFLEKVDNWYREVCGILKGYLNTNDGPICFVQVCNEVPGIHIWHGGKDANPETLGLGKDEGLYPTFLKEKYGSLGELNEIYGSNFKSFKEVTLPNEDNSEEVARNNDWDEFYFDVYLTRYFKILMGKLKKYGIDTKLTINAGNPNNVLYLKESSKKNKDLILGTDNYYHLFENSLGSKGISYFIEFGSEMVKEFYGDPAIVWEFETGFWHDWPQVYAPHIYEWIVWTFINGYKGINMYLFAGGTNRPGMGVHGEYHEWQAPITSQGELKEHYFAIQRALKEVKTNKWILDTDKVYDISLGIYSREDVKETAHLFFLNNTSYKVLDIKNRSLEDMLKYKLWMVLDEFMDAETQAKLKYYIQEGGHLVIQDKIPLKNLINRDMPILKKFAQAEIRDLGKKENKILLHGSETFIGFDSKIVEMEGDVLATTLDERPSIVSKKIGKGSLTIIPFKLTYKFKSQLNIINKILEHLDMKQLIKSDRLHGILRRDKEGREMAFFLNYHPVKVKEKVAVKGDERLIELEPFSYTRYEVVSNRL